MGKGVSAPAPTYTKDRMSIMLDHKQDELQRRFPDLRFRVTYFRDPMGFSLKVITSFWSSQSLDNFQSVSDSVDEMDVEDYWREFPSDGLVTKIMLLT